LEETSILQLEESEGYPERQILLKACPSFENLIKTIGKELTPSIHTFLFYLENCENESNNSVSSLQKIRRESSRTPKLIYYMENLESLLIKYTKRVKYDGLMRYFHRTQARDFRIKVNQLTDLDNQEEEPKKKKQKVKKEKPKKDTTTKSKGRGQGKKRKENEDEQAGGDDSSVKSGAPKKKAKKKKDDDAMDE